MFGRVGRNMRKMLRERGRRTLAKYESSQGPRTEQCPWHPHTKLSKETDPYGRVGIWCRDCTKEGVGFTYHKRHAFSDRASHLE